MLFITFTPIVLMIVGTLIGGGYRTQNEIVEILNSPTKTLKILNEARGIMALEILVNHIFWNSGVLSGRTQAIWGPLTFSVVSYFFFVSGYGMQLKEFKNRIEIITEWVRKSLFLLLVSSIAVLMVFFFRLLIGINSENVLKYLFSHTNWYVYELLIFYLIFYIANILFFGEKGKTIIFTFICSIALILILSLVFDDKTWCISSLGFAFGMICSRTTKGIYSFFKKHILVLLLLIVLSGAFHLFRVESVPFLYAIAENSLCLAFIITSMVVFITYKCFNLKACNYLTLYSLEIYLAQFIWLPYIKMVSWPWYLGFYFVFILTMVSAFILKPLYNKCRCMCHGSHHLEN